MKAQLKELQKIYQTKLNNNNIPLPRIIHIETRTKCNGLCSFCEASVKTDKREDKHMSLDLVKMIINELKEVDYSNRLSFYNNNEPFIDKRIFEMIKLARTALPYAYLELKSNGKNLTKEMVFEIFNAGLDMLYINDYKDDYQMTENVKKIKEELNNSRRLKGHLAGDTYHSRIMISSEDINKVKGTRAGTSPNKKFTGKPLDKMCMRPFEMITIGPDGQIGTCSEDFHYAMNMGNVDNNKREFTKLFDLWTGEKWNNLRKELINGNRSYNNLCSKCDYRGHTFEILNENGLYKPSIMLNTKAILKNIYISMKSQSSKVTPVGKKPPNKTKIIPIETNHKSEK